MVGKRRGMLAVLAAVSIFSSPTGAAPTNKSPERNPSPGIQQKANPAADDLALSDPAKAEDLLIDSYLPQFKRNEGESLSFYRCAQKKVTVGYGSNVQNNPHFLDGITIYHNGKALSAEERKTFMTSYSSMDLSKLSKYSVSRSDAEKMAKKSLKEAIQKLTGVFTNKEGQSIFYNLPLPMQALTLDIFLNVGEVGFGQYKKYKTHILKGNYAAALSEATVYTNKKTKATNLKREWAKKRMYEIMTIVQANKSLSQAEIRTLITKNYNEKTSFKRRAQNRHTFLADELTLAMGELRHVRWVDAVSAERQKKAVLQASVQNGNSPFVPPIQKTAEM